MSLYNLRAFFQPEQFLYMSATEDARNAIERNLSLLTEDTILGLRDAAQQFAQLCESEIQSR